MTCKPFKKFEIRSITPEKIQKRFVCPQEEYAQAMSSKDSGKCTHCVTVLVLSFISIGISVKLTYGSAMGLKYAFRVCA
jgi:hypothetical protein